MMQFSAQLVPVIHTRRMHALLARYVVLPTALSRSCRTGAKLCTLIVKLEIAIWHRPRKEDKNIIYIQKNWAHGTVVLETPCHSFLTHTHLVRKRHDTHIYIVWSRDIETL